MIPADMRYFKEKTTGKVIIMGRATLESLPGGKALKNRKNIVLSKRGRISCEDVIVCHSLEELFVEVSGYSLEEIFVIGGEMIYSQLLQYCSEAYITKINKCYKADKYLPNLDNLKGWKCTSKSILERYDDLSFSFSVYKNMNFQKYHR